MAMRSKTTTYQTVDITVDSGAAEVVAPPTLAEAWAARSSPGSCGGAKYRTASVALLSNSDEEKVTKRADGGDARTMTFKVPDVTKPLALVGRITSKGHPDAPRAKPPGQTILPSEAAFVALAGIASISAGFPATTALGTYSSSGRCANAVSRFGKIAGVLGSWASCGGYPALLHELPRDGTPEDSAPYLGSQL